MLNDLLLAIPIPLDCFMPLYLFFLGGLVTSLFILVKRIARNRGSK